MTFLKQFILRVNKIKNGQFGLVFFTPGTCFSVPVFITELLTSVQTISQGYFKNSTCSKFTSKVDVS